MEVFYDHLADWWPVISPVSDYTGECAEIRRVLKARRPHARSLLELGSGGGHVAFHLKVDFDCTLTDLSPALNPGCLHIQGDMRTLDLDRHFDIVLAHDAIAYMTSEADLRAAFATAHRHLAPGGLALFVPDEVLETFELGDSDLSLFGGETPDGRSARAMEWCGELAADGTTSVHYAFLLKDADGQVTTAGETHHVGVFARADWERWLEAEGFAVETVEEQTDEDRTPRFLFVGTRTKA